MGVFAEFVIPAVCIIILVFIIFLLGRRKKRIDESPFGSGWKVKSEFSKRLVHWLFFVALFFVADIAFLLLLFSEYATSIYYILTYIVLLIFAWILITIEALRYV